MGTRHHQMVINKKGEIKLSQYGQWDGYPSGQGIEILRYLKNADLNKYEQECDKLREITEQEDKEIEKLPEWKAKYPYLSRDCGSKIHAMIEAGQVEFVSLMSQREADKWCEGFYIIDFRERTFTSNFHELSKIYSLDDLPTDEKYLQDMSDE